MSAPRVEALSAEGSRDEPARRVFLRAQQRMKAFTAQTREGDPALLGEGGLFEVERWSAIPGTNLVVQLPDAVEANELEARAADLAALRESGRVEWAGDAGDAQAGTYGLAWEPTRDGPRWVLYPPDGKFRALTPAELRAWKPDGGRPRVVATLPPTRALAKDLAERWTRPGGLVTVTASRPDARGPGGEALPLDLLLPATQRFRGVGVVPQPTDWTLRRIALTSVQRDP